MNCVTYDMCRKFKNLKISYIFEKKNQFFLFFAVRTQMKLKKFLNKNNQLSY